MPIATNRYRCGRVWLCAALVAAVLIALGGCKKLKAALTPGFEGSLMPLAAALAAASDADLRAIGADLPAPGEEFEISARHARDLLQRIQRRMKLEPGVPTDLEQLEHHRFFLRQVTDPYLQRARISRGIPRPYTVTVFALNADGYMDRTRCYSY